MKRVGMLAGAVATVLSTGCALTDYELITDNDQGGVVDTNGKAYVKFSSQVVLHWPDGTDNLYWACDQKANGDRVLTTYNYFTTEGDPFLDDLYCTPDRGGCAIIVAEDPEVDDDPYDYRLNPHCPGTRSVEFLLSAARDAGECGRARSPDGMLAALALANSMDAVAVDGRTMLYTIAGPQSLRITIDKAGSVYELPVTAPIGVLVDAPRQRAKLDLTHPLLPAMMKNLVNFDRTHNGRGMTATLTLNGVSGTVDFALTKEAGHVR